MAAAKAKKRLSAAEQRRRADQAKKAARANGDGQQPEQIAPEQVANGVLISPVYGPDGNIQVTINLVGDVRATEIITLLEQAVKLARANMGL